MLTSILHYVSNIVNCDMFSPTTAIHTTETI